MKTSFFKGDDIFRAQVKIYNLSLTPSGNAGSSFLLENSFQVDWAGVAMILMSGDSMSLVVSWSHISQSRYNLYDVGGKLTSEICANL